jgi:mycothiol synthase
VTGVAFAQMERAFPTPAAASDAAAVTEVVLALESSLYGQSAFSQADLEEEWSELDPAQDARVVRDGDRIVGYGVVRERGELWRVEGYVHPDALGRGIGKLIATGLEEAAVRGGARRIQNAVLEADAAARRLLESLGYGAVRVFRELRIELEAPPPAPEWPDGLSVVPFDAERDALEFHAAHQEAFADHWDYTPVEFESWSEAQLRSERFDPTLWCVVRAGDEIAAGTICTGDTYGGGFVHTLFTRRPWRRQGVGAALLYDSFGRFWERGEHSVGLGADTESDTGAFRLYERAGMTPRLGWVAYERELWRLGARRSVPDSLDLS